MECTEADVVIYTDGSCLGNPGPGGWGAILVCKGRERHLSGGDPDTTNNRMELMAAIAALEALRDSCRVKLYTDSAYVKNGMSQWMRKWKATGALNSGKEGVKNHLLEFAAEQATKSSLLSSERSESCQRPERKTPGRMAGGDEPRTNYAGT